MENQTAEQERKEIMELFGLSNPGEELLSLHLSSKSYNCLVKAGIVEVSKLVSLSDESLISIKGMNKKILQEIREKIASYYFKSN